MIVSPSRMSGTERICFRVSHHKEGGSGDNQIIPSRGSLNDIRSGSDRRRYLYAGQELTVFSFTVDIVGSLFRKAPYHRIQAFAACYLGYGRTEGAGADYSNFLVCHCSLPRFVCKKRFIFFVISIKMLLYDTEYMIRTLNQRTVRYSSESPFAFFAGFC